MQEGALGEHLIQPTHSTAEETEASGQWGGTPSKWQSSSVLMTSPVRFPLHHESLKKKKKSTLTSTLELLKIHVNCFLPAPTKFINSLCSPLNSDAHRSSARGIQLVWKTEKDHRLNFLELQRIVVPKHDHDLGGPAQCLGFLIGETGFLAHPAPSPGEGWLKLGP